ncbi:hypothetical protein GCM10009668_21990 [Nocardioides dubius]|uniref:Superoxide dismutase family protein n=1 Tax=Nocardioides dubius TaxID=317019 RepID=A0ABN1TUC2_9ACTN
MRSTTLRLGVAALVALSLTACGSDDDGDTSDEHAGSDHSASSDGEDHSGHVMNEPDATPANELTDADLREGTFTLLDTAPPGSDAVAGDVWVAENSDGTTVTVALTGLAADTDYMLHLHDAKCEVDNGGGHFAFDPAGSDQPPNEVHLAFTSDANGAGTATVTNPQKVGDAAKSIVVHPAELMDNRLACANF